MSMFDRQWFLDVRAKLDQANGLKPTSPQNDIHAIHKAPEVDYSGLYAMCWGVDPGVAPVLADDYVRDAQGNLVMDYGFPVRKASVTRSTDTSPSELSYGASDGDVA